MGDQYEPLPAANDAPPPPPPPAAPPPPKSPAKSAQNPPPLQRKAKPPVPTGGGGASRKKRRSVDAPSVKSNITAPSSGSLRPKSEYTRPLEDDDGGTISASKNNNDVRFYCLVASAAMAGVSAFTMIVSGVFLFFG
uniref:WH2 domain-containing protein n=1 Tax=Panagrellus redivivus TaxID=6233 RepID=A0A7E4VS84_PANRE